MVQKGRSRVRQGYLALMKEVRIYFVLLIGLHAKGASRNDSGQEYHRSLLLL
jgi:hypothetical protein